MTPTINVQIEASWKALLQDEFEKPYFFQIVKELKEEKSKGIKIYPPGPLIFNAFNQTALVKLKVVVIGQDPYHGPGEAMGLSFSVPRGVRVPPSLKNIYKELHTDIGFNIPDHGDLSSWARQGVFLLNAILTVEHKNAGSHRKIGWHLFTDAVIQKLSDTKEGLVFLLWGNFAKSKKVLIDETKHHILEAAHPSPLAGGKFFGCKHFSKTNELLESPVDWQV
jgi:uracil-DNA glycosylase